jgi:hypothetical protein
MLADMTAVAQRCVGEAADHADLAEEPEAITKRSRCQVGRDEITRR